VKTAGSGRRKRGEAVCGALLSAGGLSLCVAESCTGGRLAHRITSVPGSSGYFAGGVVAYSNAVKIALLGVSRGLIERRGAVSAEVASAMALGAARLMGADLALATTGVAGPSGGRPLKPVGLVYIALAGLGRVVVRRRMFAGSRGAVREAAASAALDLLEKSLNRSGGKPGPVRKGERHGKED
jgi:nicotinamide-nucleotide amidase